MNPTRDLTRLLDRLEEMADVLGWPEDRLYLRVEEISAWSPAQHVDHTLQSLELMLGRASLLSSGEDPDIRPHGRPSFMGGVVLRTGWIPRGKAEAPSVVLPDPRPVRHRLREAHHKIRLDAEGLAARATGLRGVKGTLPHPLLGAFGAPAWVRFADLHTRHHLRIVSDIDRRRAVGVRHAGEAANTDEPGYGVSVESP